jgi:anti-sigma factor RsiW
VTPRNADCSGTDPCRGFLARHSDYMDGLLPADEAARLQLHIHVCRVCARYDRIVRQGADLVRDLPEVAPSPDFEQRLQHRLYHIDDAAAMTDVRPTTGAVASLAVAGIIALLAWSPLMVPGDADGDAVAVTERGPPMEEAFTEVLSHVPPLPEPGRLPIGAGDLWQPDGAVPPLSSADIARIFAAFPGPYSPLVVTPPVHGSSVRTISTGYSAID